MGVNLGFIKKMNLGLKTYTYLRSLSLDDNKGDLSAKEIWAEF
jgi:hypothetical protein